VRTEKGRKMSKSDPEGSIDPMELINEYGADALRLALVSGASAGNDQRLGRSKIVDNRNFANKLWNIARYVEGVGGESNGQMLESKTPADHWILNKSSILTGVISQNINDFHFSDAYQSLYHFVWDDLADWYIEASKSEPNPALLRSVLESTLIVAHPFAPFITEAIWQNLEFKKDELLAKQQLPKIDQANKAKADEFEDIKEIVTLYRRYSKAMGSNDLPLLYKDSSLMNDNKALIASLGRIKRVEELDEPAGLRLPFGKFNLYIGSSKEMAHDFLVKLTKESNQVEAVIRNLKGRLANDSYVQNAPEELINTTRSDLNEAKRQAELIQEELKTVNNWLNR
jgi:valyl-tRNA synthetase